MLLAVVVVLQGASLCGAASPALLTGIVRDSAGIPQIGAVVELLAPDLSVLTTVYTDAKGRYNIHPLQPGRYSVKAIGASFLPSMRENVRVRSVTIVNLTLNTLYEVMQWLPAEPRAANSRSDDWAWTLRSAANRPLLRWLEDGPLVVVCDGNGTAPRLKARIIATGQSGSFGESGERYSAAVQATPTSSRSLLARVDFDPETNAGIESMLGFSQDLGFAGSVQSVAAVSLHPEIDGLGPDAAAGLEEAAVRTWQTINLGDEIDAQVGATQVLARMAQNSPNTILNSLPFASLSLHQGASTFRYSMATFVPREGIAEDSQAATWLPRVSGREGQLGLEHGLHQEIGWERRSETSGLAIVLFSDNVDNPALEAMGGSAAGTMLFDQSSGLMRVAGPDFGATGMVAFYERRLPGGNHIRLSYANGDALVMPAQADSVPRPVSASQLVSTARPRRTQTYALSLSGTLDGTGTRWRASYRWQPEDTVTSVAPFAADSAEPYMNVHIRQPIHLRHDGIGGFEALVDVNNLLAQGYRPFFLSDGSVLVFAQDQRAIRAGLEFTF